MDEIWGNLLDRSPTMWNYCKVEQTECTKQAGTGVGVWSQQRRHGESLGWLGKHITTKSSLLRHHLLNLKVLSTSKALKRYTSQSSTSMTNCCDLMLKPKLNICMMNCDDYLRRFKETLTNWHLNFNCKKWLSMTCSNNKIWTLIFVKKIAHLTGMCT